MQLTGVLAGVLVGNLIACTQRSSIQDQFRRADYQLTLDERLRSEVAAPLIVLGKVTGVSNVGRPMRSPGDPRIKTQLTAITIEVEEVIKGRIQSNSINFYFFAYSSENTSDLGVPRYMPEAGQRRVYFLKPWEGTYRSVGDVTPYNLAVWSGAHSRGFCDGKEPGCCVAYLLLVPGQDLNREAFVRELGPAAYSAGVLCSPDTSQRLLEQLAQNSDARIADAAIDILSIVSQWWPQTKVEPLRDRAR